MRRILFVLASAVVVVGMTAAVALADSPNFHYANASINSSTGALEVNFKLSGLGNTVTSVNITLTTGASAEYQCWNNGGKHPKAGNKEDVNGPLSTGGNFPVRNGSVTGTITAGPLSQGSFSCPSGQSLYLESVGYSGPITISTTEGGGASTTASPSTLGPLTGLHIFIQ
jgi:hypothetical protein